MATIDTSDEDILTLAETATGGLALFYTHSDKELDLKPTDPALPEFHHNSTFVGWG